MSGVGWLGKLVGLIGIITALSGVGQMIWPAVVLTFVGADTGASSRHFFGIVGMFMALFGGLALHGVRAGSGPALLWSGLQKFGAVAAVVLGIRNSVFSLVALPIAGFDLASGILIALYWWKVSASRAPLGVRS